MSTTRNVHCNYNFSTTDGRVGTISKTWKRQADSKAAREFAVDVIAHALDSQTVVSLRIDCGARHDFVMSVFCDGHHYWSFYRKSDGSIGHRQA